MSAVRFYHLRTKTLEQALPELLTRALDQGKRIVVKTPDAATAVRLNDHLWTWRADSFLPHSVRGEKDGEAFAAAQPVWLTPGNDNPNGAGVLMLTHGAAAEAIETYELACDIFDGNDEAALSAARARWKDYTAQGHAVTYWQQNDRGGWEQKS